MHYRARSGRGRSGKHPLWVYRSELCVLVTQKLLLFVPLAYENTNQKKSPLVDPRSMRFEGVDDPGLVGQGFGGRDLDFGFRNLPVRTEMDEIR